MNTRLVLVALIAAAVGAGAGWWAGHADAPPEFSLDLASEPEESREAILAAAPILDSAGTALKATQATLADEVARRESAETEATSLREELARLQKDAAAGRLAGGTERSVGVRYGHERYAKTLKSIDWAEAGQALSRMTPLMGELIQSKLDGKPPPPSAGDIQKYNGALVKLALTAEQQGVPGTGTNGAFTHLAISANLVYATLLQAELPLDEGQQKRLGDLADELLAEDERRLAGYSDDTLALRKLFEEAALKDRFYDGVDALVSKEQREALHPKALRGLVQVDLFSSGLVWAAYLKPARFKSVEQLKAVFTKQVISRYEIEAAQHGTVGEAVDEWLSAFPRGYLDGPLDPLVAKGLVGVDRVRTAAKVQLAFFRRLLERLPADAPGIATIRAESAVVLPLRRP